MLKIRASQIFTRTPEEAAAAKKELDADLPFIQAVEKFSVCPSKEKGGDLGWMDENNLGNSFGLTLTVEDKGKVFGPVHSPYGYHILMFTDVVTDSLDGKEGPFIVSTPMREVSRTLPGAEKLLFEKFQIGLPVLGYDEKDTIQSLSESQNKNVEEILGALNSDYQKRFAHSISCEELQMMLEDGAPVNVLDVREQWEYDIAKIKDSQRITPNNNETILSKLNQEDLVVVVDWNGDRGASFQKWLSQRGFSSVKCLEGGIDRWADKIDNTQGRYEIDEDDEYRYEDVLGGDDK
jgi:rhodanese-related sulfurtransferase